MPRGKPIVDQVPEIDGHPVDEATMPDGETFAIISPLEQVEAAADDRRGRPHLTIRFPRVVTRPITSRRRMRAGRAARRASVITSALSASTAPAAIANTATDVGAADVELIELRVADDVDADHDRGHDDEHGERDHDAIEHDDAPVALLGAGSARRDQPRGDARRPHERRRGTRRARRSAGATRP